MWNNFLSYFLDLIFRVMSSCEQNPTVRLAGILLTVVVVGYLVFAPPRDSSPSFYYGIMLDAG